MSKPTEPFILSEAFATGEEISEVVARLEDVLQDVPDSTAIISLVSLAIYMQMPTVDMEKLPSIAYDVSKYICMQLVGIDVAENPGRMN